MPAEQRGSAFRTPRGWGVRWVENGRRPQKTGFASKSAALRYYRDDVAPRLGRTTTINPSITLATFVDLYLDAHALNVEASSLAVLRDRLRRAHRDVRRRHAARVRSAGAADRRMARDARRGLAVRRDASAAADARAGHPLGRHRAQPARNSPGRIRSRNAPRSCRSPTDELDRVCRRGRPVRSDRAVRRRDRTDAPSEWIALERRDMRRDDRRRSRRALVSAAARSRAYGKTARSPAPRAAVGDGAGRARRLAAAHRHAARVPRPSWRLIDLHNWRRRDWRPRSSRPVSRTARPTRCGTPSRRARWPQGSASTNSRGTWARASR